MATVPKASGAKRTAQASDPSGNGRARRRSQQKPKNGARRPVRKIGRPSKLTPEVTQQISGAIRVGNYAEVAARSAGISRATFYAWMQRGRDEHDRIEAGGRPKPSEAPYLDFLDAVKKADAEAEVYAVTLVRRAMPDQWQAAMTYLERRHPDRWSRRERHAIEVGGGPEPIRLEMTVEEERERAAEVARVLVDSGIGRALDVEVNPN